MNRAYNRTNRQKINGRRIQCVKLFQPKPRSRSWSRFEEVERSRSRNEEAERSRSNSKRRSKSKEMLKLRSKEVERLKERSKSQESPSKIQVSNFRERSKSLEGSVSPMKKDVIEEIDCD